MPIKSDALAVATLSREVQKDVSNAMADKNFCGANKSIGFDLTIKKKYKWILTYFSTLVLHC